MVRSFRGGGCKDPSQPHAYLVIMFTFVYIIFFTSNNHTYECNLLFNNRQGSCSFWFRSKEGILHIFEQAYLSLRGKAIVSNSQ